MIKLLFLYDFILRIWTSISRAQTLELCQVFNSFASIADIIENEKTGFLIQPFDIDDYVNTLSALMSI